MTETITQEEYNSREKEYVRNRAEKDNVKKMTMREAWSWHIQEKKKFANMMKLQGVEVVK